MGHRSRMSDKKRVFIPGFSGTTAELRFKTRERINFYSVIALFLISLVAFYACQPQTTSNDDPLAGYEWRYTSDELRFDGPSPWPEIRKERIQTLLPVAMERAGVDGWAIVCRSNDNDPLARHVGCENAVSPALVYFEKRGSEVYSMIFSPPGEATALQEIALHDTVVVVGRTPGAIVEAATYINSNLNGKLALNFSSGNEIADGLSYSQYQALTGALNSRVRTTIVSSEEIVYEWLSVKTPAEVEILRRAAELTVRFQLLAYAQVSPGITTDADVARQEAVVAEFRLRRLGGEKIRAAARRRVHELREHASPEAVG